jgi:hypothetical protein
LDLESFERLKKEIQIEYLKNHSPSEEDISQWKGIDIVYFQEDLRKKVKGSISEKTFYTYFKSTNIDKLPRIDMLNMFSAYIGYRSWYEFKKSFSEETEVDTFAELEIEEKEEENAIALLDTKTTENQPKEKKVFSNIKAYIWVITSVVLALFIIVLLYSDSLFKKSYQFCFTDADRGTAIQSTINIKVIKENESPILYKVNSGECFYINTKDKTLRMEVSTPLYEKVEIFRNLEDAPEVEHIALKPDDYALMLYYYSTKDKDNSSLEHIKNRQQKLNHLISDNALIYQIFDNEIYGVETLSKQKYIGLVTTPTQSLRNLKVLDTKIENGKIIAIKFKIENNEKN